MQSPIDLASPRVSLVRHLGYLNHSYRPAQASIVNRGHDIMVPIGSILQFMAIQAFLYQ
jgi:carbonic anhydrase